MEATLTFLGSGTSMGVPTLGCDCAVCASAMSPTGDPRNRRTRPSIRLAYNHHTDMSDIPEESIPPPQDPDILIPDALRRDPHPSHSHLDKSIAFVEKLK